MLLTMSLESWSVLATLLNRKKPLKGDYLLV